MRVKLLEAVASAELVAGAGSVVELPDPLAKALVAGGQAVPAVAAAAPEREMRQAPERREAEPQSAKAAASRKGQA